MSTISGTTDLHITRDGLGWPTSLSDDASAGIETLWLRGPHSEAWPTAARVWLSSGRAPAPRTAR